MTNDEIEQQFIEDTKNHTMTVINDDGKQTRFLSFSRNGSSVYRYDIQTWPGYLLITGDMGSYIFRRINDMFDFFDTGSLNYKINPGYWAEKLEAISSNCGSDASINEYKHELFEKMIMNHYDEYNSENDISEEDAEELLDELKSDVLVGYDEYEAIQNAYSFEHGDFNLWDLPLNGCTEYKYHYIWVLYAIVDGIKQYKQAKG